MGVAKSRPLDFSQTFFCHIIWLLHSILGFPDGSDGKVSAYNAGDLDSIPGSGRSSGEGNGYPSQYSCLENPMGRGAWWVHDTESNMTKATLRLQNRHWLTEKKQMLPKGRGQERDMNRLIPLPDPVHQCFLAVVWADWGHGSHSRVEGPWLVGFLCKILKVFLSWTSFVLVCL